MNVATMTRRLEEGGFTQEQAMALAEVMHEEMVERLATKDDLGRVEEKLDRTMGGLERRLDRLEQRIDGLDQKIDRFRDELDHKIDRFREELEQRIEQVRQDLREYIHVVVGEASARLEKTIQQESKSTVKWVAGIIIVQTVALLTSVIGLVKFLM